MSFSRQKICHVGADSIGVGNYKYSLWDDDLDQSSERRNGFQQGQNLQVEATNAADNMGTPFIAFIGPTNLDGYDRKQSPSEQPGNIPKTFLDAMEVREEVFVHEQGVPLDNEFDTDDARACHWVC